MRRARAQSQKPAYPAKRCAGFSLVELIVVIVLTGILAALGAQMLGKTVESFAFSRDVTKGDWQARVALERLTRDLRMVRAPANLTIVPATAITFSDTDGNNVNYSLSSSSLMRNTQPLADGISGLAFTYLRSDGNTVETTTSSLVYYITVSFDVSRSTATTSLRATVHPRNF
jgi:prepilin-type N-terminal cleavage/methylation domain-containing protein